MTLSLLAMTSSPMRYAGAQGPQFRPTAELRTDVVAGHVTLVQPGVALAAGRGYMRLVFAAGGGGAISSGETRGSARADLGARFLLDPYRESPWGLYGYGAVSAMYDGFRRWREVLSVAVGMETPSRGRTVWAVELGLGGGIRLGVALRQNRPGAR